MSRNRDEKYTKTNWKLNQKEKRNSEKNLLRFRKVSATWKNWNRCLAQ